MDSDQIIAEFRTVYTVPVEAVRAAEQRQGEMIPLLTGTLERAIAEPLESLRGDDGLIFLAFHLLGSWRVRQACPVIVRFLGADPEKVEWALGDAITGTIHRVLFNVFDDDVSALKALIENNDLDSYVRRRTLDTLGMLVVAGRFDRGDMAAYLGELCGRINVDPEGMVWTGWAEIIAELGMRDLCGLVE